MTSVPAHFQKLVQLVARSFYAGECPPKDEADVTPQKTSKKAQVPIIGLGVIILDGLLRREWVKEDELAGDLKIHPRIMRKSLRWFEQEQLVTREHRKEARKRKKGDEGAGAPADSAAAGGAANGAASQDVVVENADELPPQALLHSYSCLDFASILDVTQLRLYKLRKLMKERVQNSQPVLEYSCPKCGAAYNTLQASALIDFRDGQFHCEHCQTVLVTAEAADAQGGQSASARRERLKAMRELQVRMEKELAPLLAATEAVKKRLGVDARVPSYGTLKEWAQAQADVLVAAARGAKRGNGTLEPARVEIDLSGQQAVSEPLEDVVARELPPWMRAEASASVSRSADSTGAAQLPGQQGAQQASSTEQESLQAAYARQWEEQVRKRQAELATYAGTDTTAQQAASASEVKVEGGWTAQRQPGSGIKPEAKQEAPRAEGDDIKWQAAGQDDDEEEEWEEA